MTTEEKALIWARNQRGNVLNNRNVDCFIAGYEMARKEILVDKIADRKKYILSLPESLRKQIESDEDNYDHCGYYSYPESHIEKKKAYLALAEALENCFKYLNEYI